MTSLQEQLVVIKPGDTVTVRIDHGPNNIRGAYQVTGVVYSHPGDEDKYLGVGLDTVRECSGRIAPELVAIESHEPAKPPVPEPQGDDVLVRLEDGERSDVWIVPNPTSGWDELGVGANDPTGFTDWAAVLAWAEKWASGPLTVYRPELSPERVEELITDAAHRIDSLSDNCITDRVTAELAALVKAATGGAS